MRPRGWQPPKLHYGFVFTTEELGAIAVKRDIIAYVNSSPYPLPNGRFHQIGSTTFQMGEHIKNKLGASSLRALEWEFVIHVVNPTVNSVREGMSLVSLGCNWTKDGLLPHDEDIKKVLDFFDQPDIHVGWYFDGSRPLWAPL
ncbi:hypothetical protein Hypma_008683 [Hypsizygus marmoreus]|uniref:Uncharacterized protein n=1 Tax=Hypsizygus marmoreus TaxID=39966 RepID=A0A369JU40_HYPMA|nr:hypothetical protein Hypma_008683 [Hypsizygus marmoreus]